jgi:hypothetical protein
MGITSIRARVSGLAPDSDSAEIHFLVDSGAMYSIIGLATLERLVMDSETTRCGLLAEGSVNCFHVQNGMA